MSDSPKPSAPAGISGPAVVAEFPAGLFFEAADYTLLNTREDDLPETRRRVSRHRSKMKAAVALQLEDLARINSSLHAADRQGNAAPHWDSAVVLLGKLQKSVAHMAVQIEKAERRHEDQFRAVAVES